MDILSALRFVGPGLGRFVVARADLVTPLLPLIIFVLPSPFAVGGGDEGQPCGVGEGGGLGVVDGQRPMVVGGGVFFTVADMPMRWQFEQPLTEEGVYHGRGPAYSNTIVFAARMLTAIIRAAL